LDRENKENRGIAMQERKTGKRGLAGVIVFTVLFTVGGGISLADQPDVAPTGQLGVLTVRFEVSGDVDKRVGKRGEGIHWSTRRSFESTIKVQAEKPEKDLLGIVRDTPDVPTQDLQKQMEACKEDDMPCQMALAMQMANSPQMQAMIKAGEDAKKAPARYQLWTAVPGVQPEVKMHYEEQWETIFYTAAKEVTTCTLIAPALSPELKKNASGIDWEKQNQEQLHAGAQVLAVEKDIQQGGNRLRLFPISVFGDLQCSENIGGQIEKSRDSSNISFFPDGWQAPGAMIAGNGEYETVFEHGLGQTGWVMAGGGEVKVPMRIKLSWSLRRE
jgi:hypothetical protein